jgi:lipopolysaccharide biosynthesis glycosyltransferase
MKNIDENNKLDSFNIISQKKIKKFNNNIIQTKCFYFIIIFGFILFIYFFTNIRNLLNINIIKIKQTQKIHNNIIESNFNYNFEKIKERFSRNEILKNYLKEIHIKAHIYHINKNEYLKYKNNIHICVSLNNKYIYPLLVSMESVLINSDKNKTFITYHILCTPDIKANTLLIIKSLMRRYSTNLELILYNMGSCFEYRMGFKSQAVYYRILSPIILNIDKIIYLDGDTITLKDLSDMYKIEFNDNYMLGFLDIQSGQIDHLGKRTEKYTNTGVILLNLEKIRNDNKIFEMLNIVNTTIFLPSQDQTVFNFVLYPKIGRLPSKYGIWNFEDKLDIEKYLNSIRQKIDINELEEALKDPSIFHTVLCCPKLWFPKSKYSIFSNCKKRGNCNCRKYINLWLSYAQKTEYYKQIRNFMRTLK